MNRHHALPLLPFLLTLSLLTTLAGPSHAQLDEERIAEKRELLDQCQGELTPELRETLARTEIVDDHVHLFNLLYLPVEGIFHRFRIPVIVAGPLAAIFEDLVERGAMDAGRDEALEVSPEQIEQRLSPAQRQTLEELEPKLRKSLERIERDLLAEQIDRLPGRSESADRAALSEEVELALDLLAVAVEPELTEKQWLEPRPESAGTVGGFLSFIGNTLRREDAMAAELMADHPLVDRFVHHMMDLEHIYTTRPEYAIKECRHPCEEPTEDDPLARAAQLGELEPGLAFSVAFDPFRGPAAIDHVERGLALGAVAVKLYPPSGYRPADNDIPPKPSLFKGRFPFFHVPVSARRQVRKQWKSRYDGLDNATLDRRLSDFFDLVDEREVPIFSHHTPVGFEALGKDGGRESYGTQMAPPCHWLSILEHKPELRLVLSHSGGGEGWLGCEEDWQGSFDQQAYNLCVQYPNVYCDFGHLQEVLDEDRRRQFAHRLDDLTSRPVDSSVEPGGWDCASTHEAPARFDLRDKMLYGSDWFLISRIPQQESLVCGFAQVFDHSPALRQGAARFFGDNARRVFGLE